MADEKGRENLIRQGGLMRCCIQTIVDFDTDGMVPEENTSMGCKWCDSSVIYRDGAWEWDRS